MIGKLNEREAKWTSSTTSICHQFVATSNVAPLFHGAC